MRILKILFKEIKHNKFFFFIFLLISIVFLMVSSLLFTLSNLIKEKSVSLFCDFSDCWLTFQDVSELDTFEDEQCFFYFDETNFSLEGIPLGKENYQIIFPNKRMLSNYSLIQGKLWDKSNSSENGIWLNDEIFVANGFRIGQEVIVNINEFSIVFKIIGTYKENSKVLFTINTLEKIIGNDPTMNISIDNENAAVLYKELLEIRENCDNDYGYFEGMRFMDISKTLVISFSIIVFVFSCLIINQFLNLLFLKRGKIYSLYEAFGFTQKDIGILTILMGLVMSILEFFISGILSVLIFPIFEGRIELLFAVDEQLKFSFQFIAIIFLVQVILLSLKAIFIVNKRGRNSLTSFLKEVV